MLINGVEAITAGANGRAVLVIASTEPERGRVVITVRDSGIGAQPVELDRIFDHFVTSKRHGLGMGLAINRSILEAHGGRIWASANADRGLTLHIELPAPPELASGTDAIKPAGRREPGPPVRVASRSAPLERQLP